MGDWHQRNYTMASQRVFQLGLRRAAAPSLRVQPAGRMVQRRLAATEHASQSEAAEILAKQRVNRPVSPHLAIYKPQITWIASGLNRITGVTLSGSLYLFGIAYLIAPYTGCISRHNPWSRQLLLGQRLSRSDLRVSS